MTWPMVKLGDVCTTSTKQIAPGEMVGTLPYLGLEHLRSGGGTAIVSSVAKANVISSKFRFESGHILFGKLRPNLRKVTLVDFEGVCSTDILPLSVNENVDRTYIYHFLLSQFSLNQVLSYVNGANLPRIKPTDILNIKIPLPPLEEQRRIASLLCKSQDSINRVVTETKLLESAITQIVRSAGTAGHPVRKLGDLCQIASGGTPSSKNPDYWDGSVPWITPKDLSDLHDIYVDHGSKNISEEGLRSSSAKLLPTGTVVMSSRAPIGYVAITALPLATNQGFKNFITGDEISNVFLAEYLKCNTAYLQSQGSGATFKEISATRAKALEIKLPPMKVQAEVAEKTSLIRSIIADCNRKMQLLQELHQSLATRAFAGEL